MAAALSGTTGAVVSVGVVTPVVVSVGEVSSAAPEDPVVGEPAESSFEHPASTAAVAPAPARSNRRRPITSRARDVGRSPCCIEATVGADVSARPSKAGRA